MKQVSRKRKTVHRKASSSPTTPTPTHACKGCGAPFPLLDAMARQFDMDWSKAGILCGACQKPVNITVKVSIDTKPFEEVMNKIQKQLSEFTSEIDQLVVEDVRIKETPKPKLVGESFKVNFQPIQEHMNVRIVTAPMEFAKVKDSLWKKLMRKLGGNKNGNSSKRPDSKGATQDAFNLSSR